MTAEQWRTALRIYSTAQEIALEERKVFIDSASADAEVVQQVLNLLEASTESDISLSATAAPTDRTGTRIGRYEVGKLLGRGGMGEVYAAHDAELDRPVALKFLLSETVGDRSGVSRFVREAKAASALNHPNILIVYEVVYAESGPAIAMELVEGKGFREFRGTPLAFRQVVNLGRQVASALAAAHGKGIMHRDIKPENLMLREDGLVKVLDFGLARGFAAQARVNTSTSGCEMAVGTPPYMSPEQLRGDALTGASDVFSLGIVLYELATGRHPFEAKYTWERAHAIHSREPAPPASINAAIPSGLEALILAMLAKDPSARPSAPKVMHLLEPGSALKDRREMVQAGIALPCANARWSSKVGRGFLLASAALGVFIAALGALSIWTSRRDAHSNADLEMAPLTNFGGSKGYASISPDGSRFAFSWRPSNQLAHHIYVKSVAHGEPMRLTFASAEDDLPAWSPDGREIAFCRHILTADERGQVSSAVFLISALGGAERKVADSWAGASWSANGQKLAVARAPGTVPDSGGIDLLSLDSGVRRELTRSREDLFPIFSPNGKWVAFTRVLPGNRGRGRDIFVVPATGGAPRRLTFDGEYITGAAWTADSREIVFSSSRERSQGALWRIPISGGAPRPISATLRNASFPSISRQGGRLVFTESWSDPNIYIRTGPGFPRAGMPWRFDQPLGVALSTGLDHSPAFSPDAERFAFVSDRNGDNEIWVARRDGSEAASLVPIPLKSQSAGSPHWSPDGAWIAFDLYASNQSNVYVVSSSGGTPRRASLEPGESWNPAWSPDGRWIYFASRRTGARQIWKMPAAGGPAVQITYGGAYEGRPSLDGKTVYFRKSVGGVCCAIWSVPAAGGRERPVPELESFATITPSWGVLEQGIYFIAKLNPRQTVRFLSFATGEVTDVVTLEKEPALDFDALAMSADGRYLLTAQIDREMDDLVMIDNFR